MFRNFENNLATEVGLFLKAALFFFEENEKENMWNTWISRDT